MVLLIHGNNNKKKDDIQINLCDIIFVEAVLCCFYRLCVLVCTIFLGSLDFIVWVRGHHGWVLV